MGQKTVDQMGSYPGIHMCITSLKSTLLSPALAKAWGLLFLVCQSVRQSLRDAVTKTLTLVITSEP